MIVALGRSTFERRDSRHRPGRCDRIAEASHKLDARRRAGGISTTGKRRVVDNLHGNTFASTMHAGPAVGYSAGEFDLQCLPMKGLMSSGVRGHFHVGNTVLYGTSCQVPVWTGLPQDVSRGRVLVERYLLCDVDRGGHRPQHRQKTAAQGDPTHGLMQPPSVLLQLAHATGPPMTRTKDDADSALRDAISSGDAVRVQALLDEGADLTTLDDQGITPLMVAAKAGAPKIVELLLRAGADPSPKDKLGYTAEMIAYWYGEYRMGAYTAESLKIVEMLRGRKK